VRPPLGNGRTAKPEDIRRAARISAAVGGTALALCAGHVLAGPVRRALLRKLARR
jgi:hypothetical protein